MVTRRHGVLEPRVQFGQILTSLTVALSIGTLIFTAGSWFQELRDDIRAESLQRSAQYTAIMDRYNVLEGEYQHIIQWMAAYDAAHHAVPSPSPKG